jgi:hypothetical protein
MKRVAVDEIEGLPGELVGRLIELLDNDALGEDAWFNLGSWLQEFIGGSAAGSYPDRGEPPAAGTLGEVTSQLSEFVSRRRWFELLQGRLSELVGSGLYEPFLVRSVRDELRRMLAHLADVGYADRERAETRKRLERTIADPAELAAYRATLAERHPADANLNDDEVRAQLSMLLESKLLVPTSPEDAVDRWAGLDSWDKHVAAFLPDDVFDDWSRRSLFRNR